ncbi:MAG: acetate/propionate family kinase [Corticimicrobacter sp.]|uniref:acetate/propionate family kinase n=1 Tax=Corticimicrobacter sp. TaxID=2678536 RepID=UPI0032DAABF6
MSSLLQSLPEGGGYIMVLNCGSSSIKFALFEVDSATHGGLKIPRQAWWSGRIENITGQQPALVLGRSPEGEPVDLSLDADPYRAALVMIRQRVLDKIGSKPVVAVAHRVVHGGHKYFEPVRVTREVLDDLSSYVPLAPLHQPFALIAIAELLALRPDLPQIACFDTGFHHTTPDIEKMLPISYQYWEKGLRRYGFHGLSYEYMSIVLAELYGQRAQGRTIVAHLGSGASLCAMKDLRSEATTMGFSALDGLMMGTRCGSIDPGAVLYLMEIEKLTLEQVGKVLYHDSGLKGVSGVSNDPRVLRAHSDTNIRCEHALALYVRRIVREIGGLTAMLGGLEMLAFTAGIGEHSAMIRRRVCRELAYLGIELDEELNQSDARVISTSRSKVKVVVEPTNEEWVAANMVLRAA